MLPPRGSVAIPDVDRDILESWVRAPSMPGGMAQRARIVLAAAGGEGTSAIARRLGVTRPTVIHWRERYRRAGVDGLGDAPRSGRPRTVDEAQILVRTLEPPPKDLRVTHSSTRMLAPELGVGDATVPRCSRRLRLQPSLREPYKFSPDPEPEAR